MTNPKIDKMLGLPKTKKQSQGIVRKPGISSFRPFNSEFAHIVGYPLKMRGSSSVFEFHFGVSLVSHNFSQSDLAHNANPH